MADFTKLGVALTVGGAIGATAASLAFSKKLSLGHASHGSPSTSMAMAEAKAQVAARPKLYVYDHCPFCVRARMIIGLKKVPHTLQFLASHDEATPIALVGVKMAPILELPSGRAFAESMDIVRYVDTQYGAAPMLQESANREDLQAWIKESAPCISALYYARFHAAHLAEFAHHESREYFRLKKEKMVGPFEEALAKSPQLVLQANALLEKLAPLFHSNRSVNKTLSYDDIDFFGRLRGLTLVKGVHWPSKLREYMDYYAEAADVPLFDAMARF